MIQTALLLAATLALPLADAQASAFAADAMASALQVGGPYRLVAPLRAFIQEQNGTSGCTADPGFTLRAASLRLENDTSDVGIHLGNTPTYSHDSVSTREEYGPSVMEGTHNSAGCRWALFPLDGPAPLVVEAFGSCASIKPSDQEGVSRAPIVRRSREGLRIDASSALLWENCGSPAALRITGSFRLSMWEWDGTLQADGKRILVSTGPQPSPLLPGQARDASPVVARDQEAYLFVANGTLTTTLQGSGYRLYVGSGATVSAGTLLLRGATGRLSVGGATHDVAASAVALDGDLGVTLHGTAPNAPFGLQVSGQPNHVLVDGIPLAVAPAAGGSLGWLWLGAAGLVASPLAALPALRRRSAARRRRRLAERIDFLESQRAYAAAEPLARELVEAAPGDPRAHFQWGVLLSRVGQHLRAMQCHEEAHRLLQAQPDEALLVENAFAAALTAALAQAEGGAPHTPSYWIQELVKVRPRILGELELHGELAPWIDGLFGDDGEDDPPFWLQP